MIPITIECSCGQPYTFEVEPVDGQMPGTVACPTCGVDGTEAANSFIAQTVPAEPAPAAPARLRVSMSAPAGHGAAQRTVPGRANRGQAETQARAKISWGEPPPEVMAYLVVQGF